MNMAGQLAKLEKAYRQYPDLPLFARLADLYLKRGRVSQALSLCEKGCERFSWYATGFMVLSRCYEAKGALEAARRAMGKALLLDPENPGGFKRLSTIYQKLGRLDLALKSLKRAARLDPLDPELDERMDQLEYAMRRGTAVESEKAFDLLPQEVVEPLAEEQRLLESSAPVEPATSLTAEAPAPPVAGPPEIGAREEAQIASSAAEASADRQEPTAGVAAFAPAEETPAGELVSESEAEGAASEMKDLAEIAAALEARETEATAAPGYGLGERDIEKAEGHLSLPRRRTESGKVNAVSGLTPRDDDELIRLFKEIEQSLAVDSSPPEVEGAKAAETSKEEKEGDHPIATVTLAEIYAIQGLTQQAIDTYRQLLEQNPDNEEIRRKLADLEKSSRSR